MSARQESGADRAETARWLADRFDDGRSIMYSVSQDILAAFDGPGRAALETEARARRDHARGGTQVGIDARSIARRRWTEILGDVLVARRQIEAFIALREEEGLTSIDCLRIAKLVRRKRDDEALRWVERGLALDKEGSTSRDAPARTRGARA